MSNDDVGRIARATERIALVLASIFMASLPKEDQGLKAKHLSRCGFSNPEIATLLGSTTNSIGVALHRARKAPRLRKTAKKHK